MCVCVTTSQVVLLLLLQYFELSGKVYTNASHACSCLVRSGSEVLIVLILNNGYKFGSASFPSIFVAVGLQCSGLLKPKHGYPWPAVVFPAQHSCAPSKL